MIHWIDALIIIAFLAFALFSGLKNKDKASKNLEEYFLAGRSLKGWQAGVSMSATQFAADTPLLVVGLVATAGIFSLWQLWIYAISFLLMGFLLAGPWRRANVLTDAELTEIRYGGNKATVLRGVKAIYFGTIFNCTVLAMVLLAATRIAEPFLLWNEWLPEGIYQPVLSLVEWAAVPFTVNLENQSLLWILSTNNLLSIFSIVLVTAIYSMAGGLRAVVATDVFQFFIMMIGTFIYMLIVVNQTGGFAELSTQIEILYSQNTPNGITPTEIFAFTPSQAFDVSAGLLCVFGLQWLIQMNSDGTGYLSQRSMACKSDSDAKCAAVLFTFLQVFLRSIFWLPIALGLMILYPMELGVSPEVYTAHRETTFVLGIRDLLPIGVKGLLLTSMLAALASTLDTHLNWGSSYWTNDLYKRILFEKILKKSPDPGHLVWVARWSNLGILLIALFIMAHLESIQSAWKGSLLIGAAMGIPLLLRWFWWRMNAWGEIASILAATICVPIFLTMDVSNHESLLSIAGISLLVTLSAVYLKGPEEKIVLKDFYHRVQPDGFWGPVAEGMDKAPRSTEDRFLKNILQMTLCAFTCFGLLVGVGTLLVGGTPPLWFPNPILWPLTCIALGLGVVPLWWQSLGKNKQ
ncbi:MAG: sodium transporter [Nitrospinaceae bacterium]|nr:MAG: sodium transporter [Nitrospinaceae bacterium]